MSETKYLKCPCQKCGGSIEFPVHGIGMAVGCPHCGQKTTLFAPPVGSLLSGLPVATPMSTLPRATASERAPLPLPELSAAPDNPPPGQQAGAADTGPKRHVIRVTLLVLGLSITAGALWLVPRHKLL